MKKFLVTGPNGFIGTALLKVLSSEGAKVIAVVKDEAEDITRIESLPHVTIVYCDLKDIEELPTLVKDRDIDACIHLAWAGSFGNARANHALQLQNVEYALRVVDILPWLGIRRFVGAGTLAERDVLNYHPVDGSTPNAVSEYGIAKLSAHYMTKAECSKLGIEHIWCTLSNTYGEGNTTNNFVNMASRLMLEGKRAAFTEGLQPYDFIYITDCVRGISAAASNGKNNSDYFIGSTKPRQLKEYIKIIRDTIDPNIPLYLGEIPFNGNPLPMEAYSTTTLVKDTGYKPTVSFEEGICRTIDWLKSQKTPTKPSTLKEVRASQAVIITGADGFVGSYTTEYFLSQGKRVLAIDIPEQPRRLKENPNLTYLSLDLSHPERMLEKIEAAKYDTFIHFAWAGSAGEARVDYNLQTQNALNTVECLKVAHQLGCKRFVCAGSIMEYEVEAAIHTQGTKPGLGYIYGIGKLLAHCLCKPVAAQLGIDLLWPMITNAYGVGELSPRFVNTTLRKIINKEPLQFTAATQNYDFIYVTDVARAFYLISEKGKPFCEYIIGSGQARPLREFILEMTQACGAVTSPLFGDIPFTGSILPLETFAIDALKEDCGFTPEVSFGDGTKMTMDWLKTL